MRLSCIVCYELFSSSDNVNAAYCGHILHYHCWSAWLERDPHCPECREPVQKADLLKLFFTSDPEEGDYSTLSSKYSTLQYDFDSKTKEVQTANALVEKQKKEIKTLQSQVEELKSKVSELQKARCGVEELSPNLGAMAVTPSPYLSATIGAMPLMSYPAPWSYNYNIPLTNPWRSATGESGGLVAFQHTVTNVSQLQDSQASVSRSFWFHNFTWKIRLIPRTKSDPATPLTSNNRNRWLGFFLQCTGDGVSTQWSCNASADLRILPQKDGVPVLQRRIDHMYRLEESDWGYRHFVLLNDLLNPAKGYIKDDSIVVEVRVRVGADIPGGGNTGRRSSACSVTQSHNDYRKRLRQY